jgi:hypothetical protein
MRQHPGRATRWGRPAGARTNPIGSLRILHDWHTLPERRRNANERCCPMRTRKQAASRSVRDSARDEVQGMLSTVEARTLTGSGFDASATRSFTLRFHRSNS